MIGFPPLSTLSNSLFLEHACHLAIGCHPRTVEITIVCRDSRKPDKNPTDPQLAFLKSTSLLQKVFTWKTSKKASKKRPQKTLTNRWHFLSTFFPTRTVPHLNLLPGLQSPGKISQNRLKCQGKKNKKIKRKWPREARSKPACVLWFIKNTRQAGFYQF